MSNACTTLNDLFSIDFGNLPESILQHLEDTEEIRRLRKAVEDDDVKGIEWEICRKEFIQQLESLLEIKLQTILIEAWQTLDQVKDVVQEQLEKKDDSHLVIKLAEHNIRSTHTPNLTIHFNDQDFIIQIFIAIDLDIEGLTLKINKGKIKKILTGYASGKGLIQYQNITLCEPEILQFALASLVQTKVLPPLLPEKNTPSPQQAYAGIESDRVIAKKRREPLSNGLQFIIGVAIALLAVYVFWQV